MLEGEPVLSVVESIRAILAVRPLGTSSEPLAEDEVRCGTRSPVALRWVGESALDAPGVRALRALGRAIAGNPGLPPFLIHAMRGPIAVVQGQTTLLAGACSVPWEKRSGSRSPRSTARTAACSI